VVKWYESCRLALNVLHLEVDGRLQGHNLGASEVDPSSRNARGTRIQDRGPGGLTVGYEVPRVGLPW